MGLSTAPACWLSHVLYSSLALKLLQAVPLEGHTLGAEDTVTPSTLPQGLYYWKEAHILMLGGYLIILFHSLKELLLDD